MEVWVHTFGRIKADSGASHMITNLNPLKQCFDLPHFKADHWGTLLQTLPSMASPHMGGHRGPMQLVLPLGTTSRSSKLGPSADSDGCILIPWLTLSSELQPSLNYEAGEGDYIPPTLEYLDASNS